MAAVDTNILVRFLTGDDKEQLREASELFSREDLFIPDTVILETEWVLRYAYEFGHEEICGALSKVFGLPNVSLSNPVPVMQAIEWHLQGLDFADALHLAHSQAHQHLYTFDKQFIQRAKGISKTTVMAPKA